MSWYILFLSVWGCDIIWFLGYCFVPSEMAFQKCRLLLCAFWNGFSKCSNVFLSAHPSLCFQVHKYLNNLNDKKFRYLRSLKRPWIWTMYSHCCSGLIIPFKEVRSKDMFTVKTMTIKTIVLFSLIALTAGRSFPNQPVCMVFAFIFIH